MTSPEESEHTREAKTDNELLRIGNFLHAHAQDHASELLERLKKSATQLDGLVADILSSPEAKGFEYNGEFFENNTHHVRVEDGLHFLQSLSDLILDSALKNAGRNSIVGFLYRISEQDVTQVLTQLESLRSKGRFEGLVPKQGE